MDEQIFAFDLDSEVERYFDDSSLSGGAQPRIVLLTGAPAVGKTTLRKQRYSTGYVLLDSGPVFLSLCRGALLDFPGPFGLVLDLIGLRIARRAIRERRHIVTELIGDDLAASEALMEAMKAVGYRVDLTFLHTPDVEELLRRNQSRDGHDISAYYAEPFQRAWLRDAALEEAAARRGEPVSSSKKSATKSPTRTRSRKKGAPKRK